MYNADKYSGNKFPRENLCQPCYNLTMHIEELKQSYIGLPAAEQQAFAAFVLSERSEKPLDFSVAELQEFVKRAEEVKSGNVPLYSLEDISTDIQREHGFSPLSP